MRCIVLGSAAGGGVPQWNCRCPVCSLCWAGDPRVKFRTQSSLAVSVDGERWFLINCSPDVRAQIAACAVLQPSDGARNSPIAGVVLTNGDVDHVGGLLSLREGGAFTVRATQAVLEILGANPIFRVLDEARVGREVMPLGRRFELAQGLSVMAFAVPGKVPLYLEAGTPETGALSPHTVGLELAHAAGRMLYIPGCARLDPELLQRLDRSAVVLFDGTLWQDDELIVRGVGTKTGRRMGHVPISGAEGSLAVFAGLRVGRKIYTHINNTNPILIEGSPEHSAVRAAGWEVAFDGMEIAP